MPTSRIPALRQPFAAVDSNSPPLQRSRKSKWGPPVQQPPAGKNAAPKHSFVTATRGSSAPLPDFSNTSASGPADAWMPWTELSHLDDSAGGSLGKPAPEAQGLKFASTVSHRNFQRHSPPARSPPAPLQTRPHAVRTPPPMAEAWHTQLQELRTQLDEATQMNTALKVGIHDATKETTQAQTELKSAEEMCDLAKAQLRGETSKNGQLAAGSCQALPAVWARHAVLTEGGRAWSQSSPKLRPRRTRRLS